MAVKFTDEQVDVIVGTYMASIDADYDERTRVVKALALELKVTEPSVRGKLVAEKVYKKKEAGTPSTTAGVNKEDLAKAFEIYFGLDMPSIRNMTVKDMVAFWGKCVELTAVRDAENGVK